MFPWDDRNNTALTLLCAANATVNDTDPNCPCLLSGGGPELNTDVSGPGVRISFYLQALFLALLAARSNSLGEISNALYTLVVTNISMAITSLILGFKTRPEMSLHDAIIVFYLLSGSWFSIFFSLPSYNRFVKSDSTLQGLTIAHSYIVFALVLAVLATAHTFGKTPRCNSHAVGVLFYQFPALDGGRIAALVCLCLIIVIYTIIGFVDYYRLTMDSIRGFRKRMEKRKSKGIAKEANPAAPEPVAEDALVIHSSGYPDMERGSIGAGPSLWASSASQRQSSDNGTGEKLRAQAFPGPSNKRKRKRAKEKYYKNRNMNEPEANAHGEPQNYITTVHGQLMIEIFVIVVLWSLFVMNTELLIKWNHFEDDGDNSSQWGFGQILPMFLVLLPFVQLVKTFRRLGLRKRPHRIRKHQRGLSADERAAKRAQRRAEGHGHDHRFEYASHAFPWFFSMADDASVHMPGSNASARISVHSIHDSESEFKQESGTDEGSSESGSSSSASIRSVSSAPDIPNNSSIPRDMAVGEETANNASRGDAKPNEST